jgi:hypothetical protein
LFVPDSTAPDIVVTQNVHFLLHDASPMA